MPLLTPATVLGGHVEAAAVQAAVELGVLDQLACRALTADQLADALGVDRRGLAVLLEALAGLGVVQASDTEYRFTARVPNAHLLAGAREAWTSLGVDYAAVLDIAEAACHQADPQSAWLIETAWQHVWSAGVIELATRGVIASLQNGPRRRSELDVPSALVRAGEHTGVLAVDGECVALTDAARRSGFGAWLRQRLALERGYFWQPVSSLAACIRRGLPITRTSAPGSSGVFRATFTRVNVPLLPLFSSVARRIARDLHADRHARRVLELGSSLGHWGMAFAAAHPLTTLLAVDAPEALLETQRIVASARLSSQYTWFADADLSWPMDRGSQPFDVIVLHEICHTLPPERLAECSSRAVARLAPDGVLLIADMLLDPDRIAPRRHLLSAVKLLVTGGSTLLDIAAAAQLLHAHSFSQVEIQRLPTTDLLLARR